MDTKFDYSFFNIDPYKNYLEIETENNEMAKLICSLYNLAYNLITGYSPCEFDRLFDPIVELFIHLDQYVDYKDDSGLESDDDGDWPLDSKKPSRAPGPHTTWHGNQQE